MSLSFTVKLITSGLLLGTIMSTNGCATYSAIVASKGHGYSTSMPFAPEDNKWHPEWYLLLPLAVPFDIVTSPIQYYELSAGL
jgi:hypothetical protein